MATCSIYLCFCCHLFLFPFLLLAEATWATTTGVIIGMAVPLARTESCNSKYQHHTNNHSNDDVEFKVVNPPHFISPETVFVLQSVLVILVVTIVKLADTLMELQSGVGVLCPTHLQRVLPPEKVISINVCTFMFMGYKMLPRTLMLFNAMQRFGFYQQMNSK